MSSNNTGTSSSSLPRLGPAWRTSNHGGRGFQPPPAVPSDSNNNSSTIKSYSAVAEQSNKKSVQQDNNSNRNAFSLLDSDDEDMTEPLSPTKNDSSSNNNMGYSNMVRRSSAPEVSSSRRSDALRSSTSSAGTAPTGATGGGFLSRGSKVGSGRSLAELAARSPPSSSSAGTGTGNAGVNRSHHHHSARGGSSSSSGYHDDLLAGSGTANTSGFPNSHRSSGSRVDLSFVDDKNIIRYTREKLLSMRPRPSNDDCVPECLKHMEGSPLLSIQPLDPVCWDTFDAEAIWARDRAARAQSTNTKGGTMSNDRRSGTRDNSDGDIGNSSNKGNMSGLTKVGGRWQRGVALPPPEDSRSGGGRNRSGHDDAENPEDLWDDPVSSSAGINTTAASDFSAFGGSLDDDPRQVENETGGDGVAAFDFSTMAELSRKFDEDLHGTSHHNNGSSHSHDLGIDDIHSHRVDPLRPLASTGTTIKSGSGDGVNVFEDFGSPDEDITSDSAIVTDDDDGNLGKSDDVAIKAGDEQQTASSRLMQMIGVSAESDQNAKGLSSGWGSDPTLSSTAGSKDIFSAFGTSIPSNPWGDPILPTTSRNSSGTNQESGGGFDLAARLGQGSGADNNLQPDVSRQREEELELMRRRQEEEKRRAAALYAQQQAEAQARQQQMAQMQQQQQQGVSQVELILTERICTILEKSWGRSDLVTVLQHLHSEDARVIPLLGSIDALRALISRHPRRIALVKDNTFGAEMAVLLISNAQWQQQQAAEEMRRQQEQMLASQKEAKIEAEAKARQAKPENVVITNDPWYYADPQGNVQGPFSGEEMRQWLDAGYFKGDLPISQNPGGNFRTLSSIFPDWSVAFKPTSEPTQESLHEVETQEEEETPMMTETVESNEKIPSPTKSVVEAAESSKTFNDRQQQAQAQSGTNQKQSDQLKMLLGLGGAAPAANDASKSEERSSQPNKVQNSNDETKQPPKVIPQQQSSTPANSVEKPPAPAWGGAATKALQRKSMSEIQQEEAIAAARLAKQKESQTRSSGGGWAHIAASGGTTAWSGAAVIPSPSPIATSSASNNATSQARAKQSASATNTASKQLQSQTSSTQKTLEEFGADTKMSPALESWCKEQMRKLNGSEDLTLVAFCMTLSDPIEIKQYMTQYLGSTPQVNNFASEFINRKNGVSKQDNWETTNAGKKGRKKK